MTERADHLTDERIHDFLDGELDRAGERAVQAHAGSCDRCAARLAELAALLADFGELSPEGLPSRDLWPGIEARIRGGATVLPFPGSGDAATGTPAGVPSGGSAGARSGPGAEGRPGGQGGRGGDGWGGSDGRAGGDGSRRLSFTLPQLWAAGIAVALLSGGTVWFALGGAGSSGSEPAASLFPSPRAEASPVGVTDAPPGTRRTPAAAYEHAVSEFEAILDRGRHLLDPETLRTVEESLAAIETAIAEAEAALARDPGSELLNRLLLQHRQTRLRILEQAASGLPRT